MENLLSLVDEVKKQLASQGVDPEKKPASVKTATSDGPAKGSRESRSVQQVIAFSSPSFPA